MFYNQIKPFEMFFPSPLYICKSYHTYLAGCAVQMVMLTDVFVLGVYPVIARWDLGTTVAVYDCTISRSCYPCSVGS